MQIDEQIQSGTSGRISAELREPRSKRNSRTANANTKNARELRKRIATLIETKGGSLKLDIGAGTQPRGDDFVTVDAYTPADIKAMMWDIPLDDNTVDEIWSSHALEHVECAKVNATLKEWFRLLKPEGRAIIQVPDFNYVARYWLTGPDRTWAEQMVFGQQIHEGEFHKTAWTSAILKADLEQVGFKVERIEMRWNHNQETLQAVATKPLKLADKL